MIAWETDGERSTTELKTRTPTKERLKELWEKHLCQQWLAVTNHDVGGSHLIALSHAHTPVIHVHLSTKSTPKRLYIKKPRFIYLLFFLIKKPRFFLKIWLQIDMFMIHQFIFLFTKIIKITWDRETSVWNQIYRKILKNLKFLFLTRTDPKTHKIL